MSRFLKRRFMSMKDVTAAILLVDQKVFIARRRLPDPLGRKWEFPGGKVENGETPEECLRREMKEEFQIAVEVGEFFGESIYHYDHGCIRLLAYRVHWKKGGMKPIVHDEVRWVPINELPEYDFAPADVPLTLRLMTMEGD
jgi:8-oxo-dGTP diphosphatase